MTGVDRIPDDLARVRAVLVRNILAQHYDAGGINRRTYGWSRAIGDPNAVTGYSLARLANAARDLVRNNGYASNALDVIENSAVGWGIRASVQDQRWLDWADSKAIDADGRHDLAGLQAQVIRTVAESGAAIIRRRRRRLSDGLPIPLQLQILEPDFIDTSQHRNLPNGAKIVRGVELSPIGERVAYWMFREHPGSDLRTSAVSVRVPADSVLHIYRIDRPGQVHGVTWFAPALLRFRDFDEYADATLMAKKIQAAFAAFVTDLEGETMGEEKSVQPEWDFIEPGTIKHLQMGSQVTFPSLPQIRDHESYSSVTLREIAAGIGVTYEDMTGDYTRMPFSAARLSRIRFFGGVSGWRWRMLIPQMLQGIYSWSVDAATVAGFTLPPEADWTAPGLPMTEPDREGLAILRNIRAGITTFSDAIRAQGYNVDQFLKQYAEDLDKLDELGIVLDSDARKMTQQGQLQDQFASASGNVERFLGSLPPRITDRVIEWAAERMAA